MPVSSGGSGAAPAAGGGDAAAFISDRPAGRAVPLGDFMTELPAAAGGATAPGDMSSLPPAAPGDSSAARPPPSVSGENTAPPTDGRCDGTSASSGCCAASPPSDSITRSAFKCPSAMSVDAVNGLPAVSVWYLTAIVIKSYLPGGGHW